MVIPAGAGIETQGVFRQREHFLLEVFGVEVTAAGVLTAGGLGGNRAAESRRGLVRFSLGAPNVADQSGAETGGVGHQVGEGHGRRDRPRVVSSVLAHGGHHAIRNLGEILRDRIVDRHQPPLHQGHEGDGRHRLRLRKQHVVIVHRGGNAVFDVPPTEGLSIDHVASPGDETHHAAHLLLVHE